MDLTKTKGVPSIWPSGSDSGQNMFDQITNDPSFQMLSETVFDALLANDIARSQNNQFAGMITSVHENYVEPSPIDLPLRPSHAEDASSSGTVDTNPHDVPRSHQGMSTPLHYLPTTLIRNRPQEQYVKPEDWDKARPIITELYKKMSLDSVMREMEKRSFFAR